MSGLRAVLIDDEPDALELLRILLLPYADTLEIVGTANSMQSGVALVREQQPDVVFLDILMPDGTGFQLLEQIDWRKTQVIFTTAHGEFGARAFEYSALHYLLKPIDSRDLDEAIARLQPRNGKQKPAEAQVRTLEHNLQSPSKCLALPNRNGFEMVVIDNILRCEASDNYTNFILTERGPLLVSRPINQYEKLLADLQFFRVHRKHLVNLNFVQSYVKGKPGYLVMLDGSTLEVSVRRRDELLHELEQIARFS